MSITGLPGQGPVRVGIPVADLTAGLFCALGILTALHEREVSAKGQHVSTSLLQAQIFMLDFQAARWLHDQRSAQAGRQRSSDLDPDRRVQDHRRLHQHRHHRRPIWERFCVALGAEAMLKNPDYATPSCARKTARRSTTKSAPTRRQVERRVDRHHQQGRRAVRADLQHRPGVRRSAGQASRHRAEHVEEGRQVALACGRASR